MLPSTPCPEGVLPARQGCPAQWFSQKRVVLQRANFCLCEPETYLPWLKASLQQHARLDATYFRATAVLSSIQEPCQEEVP